MQRKNLEREKKKKKKKKEAQEKKKRKDKNNVDGKNMEDIAYLPVNQSHLRVASWIAY